jgi:hypothetical protein
MERGPFEELLAQHLDRHGRDERDPNTREHANAIASEKRKAAGSVTMFAATAYGESQREWRSGTSPSRKPPWAWWKLAPGIRWSTDRWSRPVNAPAATRAASAAKAHASSAALRLSGDTHAHRGGDDLEAGGRRSDLLAVELDRQVLGRLDRDRARAQQLDLRVRE